MINGLITLEDVRKNFELILQNTLETEGIDGLRKLKNEIERMVKEKYGPSYYFNMELDRSTGKNHTEMPLWEEKRNQRIIIQMNLDTKLNIA